MPFGPAASAGEDDADVVFAAAAAAGIKGADAVGNAERDRGAGGDADSGGKADHDRARDNRCHRVGGRHHCAADRNGGDRADADSGADGAEKRDGGGDQYASDNLRQIVVGQFRGRLINAAEIRHRDMHGVGGILPIDHRQVVSTAARVFGFTNSWQTQVRKLVAVVRRMARA